MVYDNLRVVVAVVKPPRHEPVERMSLSSPHMRRVVDLAKVGPPPAQFHQRRSEETRRWLDLAGVVPCSQDGIEGRRHRNRSRRQRTPDVPARACVSSSAGGSAPSWQVPCRRQRTRRARGSPRTIRSSQSWLRKHIVVGQRQDVASWGVPPSPGSGRSSSPAASRGRSHEREGGPDGYRLADDLLPSRGRSNCCQR